MKVILMKQVSATTSSVTSDGATVGLKVLPSGDSRYSNTSLGATLRMWRERLRPNQSGRRAASPRRAVGMRREEIAELAGISVDYLVRLEQGRATTPSVAIVTSLASALRLDSAERKHLYRLAGLQSESRRIVDRLSPGKLRILAQLKGSAWRSLPQTGNSCGGIEHGSRFLETPQAFRLINAITFPYASQQQAVPTD